LDGPARPWRRGRNQPKQGQERKGNRDRRRNGQGAGLEDGLAQQAGRFVVIRRRVRSGADIAGFGERRDESRPAMDVGLGDLGLDEEGEQKEQRADPARPQAKPRDGARALGYRMSV
jgi:hypothetical protein